MAESGVRAAQQEEAENAEEEIGHPGAQPRSQDAIPSEGLAGLHAAVEDEADEHPHSKGIRATTSSSVGRQWCAETEDDDTGDGKRDL